MSSFRPHVKGVNFFPGMSFPQLLTFTTQQKRHNSYRLLIKGPSPLYEESEIYTSLSSLSNKPVHSELINGKHWFTETSFFILNHTEDKSPKKRSSQETSNLNYRTYFFDIGIEEFVQLKRRTGSARLSTTRIQRSITDSRERWIRPRILRSGLDLRTSGFNPHSHSTLKRHKILDSPSHSSWTLFDTFPFGVWSIC